MSAVLSSGRWKAGWRWWWVCLRATKKLLTGRMRLWERVCEANYWRACVRVCRCGFWLDLIGNFTTTSNRPTWCGSGKFYYPNSFILPFGFKCKFVFCEWWCHTNERETNEGKQCKTKHLPKWEWKKSKKPINKLVYKWAWVNDTINTKHAFEKKTTEKKSHHTAVTGHKCMAHITLDRCFQKIGFLLSHTLSLHWQNSTFIKIKLAFFPPVRRAVDLSIFDELFAFFLYSTELIRKTVNNRSNLLCDA